MSSRGLALAVLRYVWRHPANRGRRARTLARAVAWQAWKRLTGRSWDVALAGGARLRCYPDSASASLALYSNGRPDYDEIGFLQDYLRPGDHFVDVGANVGVYTLVAATRVGEGGSVDAFEPDPEAVRRLRENLERNGLRHVRVHTDAVGASAGRVRFQRGSDTLNRILPDGAEAPAAETACVRLAEALPPLRYAAGKVDVEGAEPLVLEGAEALLAAGNPPVWVVEINGLLRGYGFTEEAFAAWIRERGYDLGQFDSDSGRLVFSDQPWHGRNNVLLVFRDAREMVLSRIQAARA